MSFEDGAFLDVDVKKTKLGTRDAPLELRLNVQWQYLGGGPYPPGPRD